MKYLPLLFVLKSFSCEMIFNDIDLDPKLEILGEDIDNYIFNRHSKLSDMFFSESTQKMIFIVFSITNFQKQMI